MIFNMVGGGGGSGATLVVSSPVNVSVTVSKDDKSYTKNSGSLGSTTFKGLATGTWTVTISGNGQTATKTIEITADYAITIAFFSATINITYPANSNCVVTNSGGQTVASDTNTTSSTKKWTATVNATGTYTVTATATDGSGKSKSQSVSITADGQNESVEFGYELDIFANGVLDNSITGGFENSNNLTIVDVNLKISYGVAIGMANSIAVTTKNSIDILAYDNVKLDVVSTSSSGPFAADQEMSLQIIRNNKVLGEVSLKGYKNQTAIIPLDTYKSGGAVKLRFHMACNEGGVSAIISRFYLE